MISYVYVIFGAFAFPILLWPFCVIAARIIDNS